MQLILEDKPTQIDYKRNNFLVAFYSFCGYHVATCLSVRKKQLFLFTSLVIRQWICSRKWEILFVFTFALQLHQKKNVGNAGAIFRNMSGEDERMSLRSYLWVITLILSLGVNQSIINQSIFNKPVEQLKNYSQRELLC